MNSDEKEKRVERRPRGPAGRGIPGEKPKNLRMAISKLFKYLKNYRLLIIFAVLLSSISSILSIIGPDKLKDLTNEISNGLRVNTENSKLIMNDIYKDFSFSIVDQKQVEDINTIINNMSDESKLYILRDTTINGVKISRHDKLYFLNLYTNKNNNGIKASDNLNKLLKPTMNFKVIKSIGLFLVIIHVISAIFAYLENLIMVLVANRFANSLRTKISKKINKLPLKYFDSHSYGDILSRVTNDVDTINMSLHHSLGSLTESIALLIGSLVMIFITNYIMAITSIMASLIGFVFITIITSKSQKYFVQRQNELGKLNGHIEEIYSSINVVKTYNGTSEAIEKFNEYNTNMYNANRMSQFLSGMMGPMMGFIGNLGYVAVCIVGSILVVKGSISFGVIVAFIMYVRLFSSPLTEIASSITNLQTATAASERVFEFIEEKEMKDESHLTKVLNKKEVKGNIEFNHVKFGYDKDKTIIKDFSAKVKPGEKIAIVGPTGAGKTTMVNLLMKFYETNSGDIKIDGVSIKDLTRENIHDLFIMVLQDTWLFNGTIKENVKFNQDNVSDERIWEALQTVGIDHFVKSLPKTLNYRLEDNESISAGQKQLLTIARGMIEDSPFLILDEATSSVDTRTEELVQMAMDKLTEGRTSFIIAHRLSTIKNADLILVMKDGNIVEQGNHEQLLKKKEFYSELYNSQFQN